MLAAECSFPAGVTGVGGAAPGGRLANHLAKHTRKMYVRP